ncbi:MAG: hypothetical protein WA152_01340 [Microgenomates group bacterium]
MEKSNQELINFHYYETDQRELKRVFQKVIQTLAIPKIDPTNDYIINIGCGESPDQIALQAFSSNSYTQLPIVGVSVNLANPEDIPKVRLKVRHFDEVELVGGKAEDEIPKIISRKGKPTIMVARNADVVYKPLKGNTNPLLNSSWKDVIQTVYDNLPDEKPGYFVLTCKNSQEELFAEIFMARAGFITTKINNPNTEKGLRLLFEPPPDVEDDQFIVVGIKNIPDHLLERMKITQPDITEASIKKAFEEAKEAEKQFKKEISISKAYKSVNKTFKSLDNNNAVKKLMEFVMRLEIDLTDEQIMALEKLADSKERLIINFSNMEDFEPYSNQPDTKSQRGKLFKREVDGRKRVFIANDAPLTIGLTSYHDAKQTTNMNIVRVFLHKGAEDGALLTIKKILDFGSH